MAEFVIESLASNLRQLRHDNSTLKNDVKHDLAMIEVHIDHLKAYLRIPTKEKQIHREHLRQITDVVYEAEDIIGAYAVQVAEMKYKNYFIRAFTKAINLHGIAQKFQSVWEQIESDQNTFLLPRLSSTSDEDDYEINEAPWRRQSDVVGLKDEIDKVRGYLCEKTEELDVITIVGMPGIGKTTLAGKIYHFCDIQYEFPIRIWIKVSNKFSERDVILNILKPLRMDDFSQKSPHELFELAEDLLEKARFLIVLDDVRSTEDWDRLKIILPKKSKKGKVLITTCNGAVGLHANKRRHPHKVRFLTQDESWALFQLEVFGKMECPLELESIGRIIAEECRGLPQAIVAMASTLMKHELSFSNMTQRKIAWTKASFTVPQFHNKIFYQSLPSRLRYCLLYFGMFPYDFDIPVWKLIRMWIAEGFVEESGDMSLEEKAEAYLMELISWNLVTVGQTKSDGTVKTCHVHRIMHEFCKSEAGKEKENFLQEILFTSDGDLEMPNCRHLCIHNDLSGFLSSKPSGPHVRSFVSFSNEEITLPPEQSSALPQAFKLLRVLDSKPITFTQINSEMCQWLYLRYLVISIDAPVLPKPFTRLSKLQTLVVDTTSRTLELKGDFSCFTELRHFKTNVATILASHGKTSSINHGQQLQTLATISPESCTKELLDRASKLRKLGIRGRLSKFFDGKSFDSLAKLENLENLLLLNDVLPKRPSQGRLHILPAANKFPPGLRILTLASTFLDWSQMRILGSLERLEVLKLKQNAFVGRSWVTEDLGFRSLQALHIQQTDLIYWIASAHNFPQLKLLRLHYCEQLREVPFQLANISTLQNLELLYSKHAATSAYKIGDEIKRRYQEGSSKDAKVFKLSVFP